MIRHLKFAIRTLSRTPFVTVVAVASLALGIGANTAIYSVFHRFLLKQLPVPETGQLVNFGTPGPKPGSTSCGSPGDCEEVFSYRMYRDLEAGSRDVLAGLVAHVFIGANIAHADQKLSGTAAIVSGSYFPTLRIQPALGRLLTPADDQTIGGHFVAVLSYNFWTSRLGSDPSVLNGPIVINGQSYTIVGVAPAGFDGTTISERPQVFVPLTMRAAMAPGWGDFEDRRSYWLYVFGRLNPGVTRSQAAASLNTRYNQILNEVEAPLQEAMSAQTMTRFKARQLGVAPGARGQSDIEEARTPLTLLLTVTAIVLLIACANVANLLLARGAQRSTEMAVRLSLGAARWHLLRQLLTESLVLAVLAGAASLFVARATIGLIVTFLPPDAAGVIDFRVDAPVLGFSAILALGTGLLFSLVPALQSTRPNLVAALKAGTGKASAARTATRFRTTLVTTQMALSMALLVCAGLFTRSLVNISRVDLGLQPDRVITFFISPRMNGYEPPRSRVFFQRVEEELLALPGVTHVTAARVAVLAGNNWGTGVNVQGFKRDPDTDAGARYNLVGPGFFKSLGMTVLAGREFTAADGLSAAKVAMVNETFARKFGLGRDVIGKRMSRGDGNALDTEIVGLVKDAKYSEVKEDVPPLFFVPYLQDSTYGSLTFYVRAAGATSSLINAVPGVVAKLDPGLPVDELKTLPQQVRANVFLDRMISTFSTAFALLATLLAAVGLYGVLSYTVAQRTNEIGVRMALGADARRVRRLVLFQVGRMAGIGGVIGIVAAIALGRAAQSILFGLEGYDPLAIVAATVILSGVAFGAGYIPARRASQVLPMQALKYD